MKTAMIYGYRDVRIDEVEVPRVGPEDVLVRVRACGICGSDVHRFLRTAYGRRFRYPLNSGHEYSGDIVKVGEKVRRFKVGDRVTLGVDWIRGGYGAFAEYVLILKADERLCKIPENMSYEEAALIEPLLVALNSFFKPQPKLDEKVLIVGAGPIGLCLLQICLDAGSQVVVSEISSRRLELASCFGAITVNALEEKLDEYVKSWTNGEGVDVAFECAGVQEALNQVFSLTRHGGRIGLIAHYGQSVTLDPEVIVGNSLDVYGPEYGTKFFNDAVKLINEKRVNLKPLISHEFPLEEIRKAFETASNTEVSVKVLVKP